MRLHQTLQLRITLNEVEPTVWRRVLVRSDLTFCDLHVALQDAMGWRDSHLHEFIVPNSGGNIAFGIPQDQDSVLSCWEYRVSDYVNADNPQFSYSYDFGDGWEHAVMLEDVFIVPDKQKLPACLSGECACPPEDCGGPTEYAEMQRVLHNRYHPGYRELKRWLKATRYKHFDPYLFDPQSVRFSSNKHLRQRLLAS